MAQQVRAERNAAESKAQARSTCRRVKTDATEGEGSASLAERIMPEVWGGPTPAVIQKLRVKGLSTKGSQKECLARIWKQQQKEKEAVKMSKKHGALPEAEGGPSPLLLEKLRAKDLPVEGDKRECMARLLKVLFTPNVTRISLTPP